MRSRLDAEVSVSQQSLMPNDVDKRPPLFICIIQLPWKVPELYNASIPKCFPTQALHFDSGLNIYLLAMHACYARLLQTGRVISFRNESCGEDEIIPHLTENAVQRIN